MGIGRETRSTRWLESHVESWLPGLSAIARTKAKLECKRWIHCVDRAKDADSGRERAHQERYGQRDKKTQERGHRAQDLEEDRQDIQNATTFVASDFVRKGKKYCGLKSCWQGERHVEEHRIHRAERYESLAHDDHERRAPQGVLAKAWIYERERRGKDGVLAFDKARTEDYRHNAPRMHRKSKDTLVISPLIEKKDVRNWQHE